MLTSFDYAWTATGQVAKVCNNLSLAIQMAGVAEAVNLGVTLGIDPAILRKCVFPYCSASCRVHS